MRLKSIGILALSIFFINNLEAQQVRLPFVLSNDNKSIFVKLPMQNQTDSLLFFFDTGAGTTMLDKEVAEKFGLKTKYKTEVSGAGGKKLYDVMINQKIFLSKNDFIDSAYIVLDDLSRLNSLYEQKFDGIIGGDILKRYITKIDFDTRIITLKTVEDPIDYVGYEKIPITFFSGIPKFPITTELKNGEKFSGDVLFDSGASLTLLINKPFVEKNGLLKKIGRTMTYTSNNLSSETKYTKGLIKGVRIGTNEFKHQNLAISFSSSEKGVSSVDSLMGIMGSEIINRFNFILDYKRKNLYLKPNALFRSEFEMIIKPLTLKYSNDRKGIYIANVIEGTDAAKKGLRTGQKIISMNNIVSSSIFTYGELLKQEGKTLTIKYTDVDEQIKTVKIRLEKLL